MPSSTKYLQKLREHIRWAHRKGWSVPKKGGVVPQTELWQVQQGCSLEGRRHSPCPCHPLQGTTSNIKIGWENREYVGEQLQLYPNMPVYMGYTLGMGRGTARPNIGTACYPLVRTWGRQMRKTQWEEWEPIDKPTSMPPADNRLLADRPDQKVDWRVCLTCYQNSYAASQPKNQLGLPPQIWQMMDLRLVKTSLCHQDEVNTWQGTNSHGGTGTSQYSEITPLLVPSMYGMVCTLVCNIW